MHPKLFAAVALGALGLASSGAAAPAAKSTLPPPADQAVAREVLQQLIEINTVDEVTPAATAMRDRLVAAGFAPGDIQLLAPPGHPEQANLVLRYHGKGKAKPILWICHLDVVQALPADWTVPPFKLTEKDGYFYGRGTADVKGDDAALVATLIRLKKEGYVPDRDLIVALTADEEDGDNNGPDFLLKNHRDLIDAELVINPDGGGGALKDGKPLYYGIQTSEKIFLTFQLEVTNRGGHSSIPQPDNAITRLAAGLVRVGELKLPVRITDTTRAWFARMAEFESGDTRQDMLALSKVPPDPAAVARYGATVLGNPALRTTCVVTEIKGGHAENALPQRAKATIQCRLLPGDTAENVQATLTRLLADPKIAITMDAPPVLSPESLPTPQLMGRIGGVVHSMWPGVAIVPTMATGFSDDRQTRTAGIPSYDVGGMWSEEGENRAHGRDERVGVQAFDENVEYVFRLMQAAGSAK